MTAAAIPPPLEVLFVCGDCAGTLLVSPDVRRSTVPDISLGKMCETHPELLHPMQATSILEAPPSIATFFRGGKWSRSQSETPPAPSSPPWSGGLAMAPPPPELPAPDLAYGFGPLTEASLRLLVAWTTVDKGLSGDETMIHQVVSVARQLLAATGGL